MPQRVLPNHLYNEIRQKPVWNFIYNKNGRKHSGTSTEITVKTTIQRKLEAMMEYWQGPVRMQKELPPLVPPPIEGLGLRNIDWRTKFKNLEVEFQITAFKNQSNMNQLQFAVPAYLSCCKTISGDSLPIGVAMVVCSEIIGSSRLCTAPYPPHRNEAFPGNNFAPNLLSQYLLNKLHDGLSILVHPSFLVGMGVRLLWTRENWKFSSLLVYSRAYKWKTNAG